MTHIYYIAVDVTKELPKPYTTVVWFVDEKTSISGSLQESEGRWWVKTQDGDSMSMFDFTHWLKPCTETGVVDYKEFLRWVIDISDYISCGNHTYQNEKTGEKISYEKLLSIFKAETQKT